MSDENKIFQEAPMYVGDEGLYAALIGTLCCLMDPMVDELDAYEITKQILDVTETLDYQTLELIVARVKMAARHEKELVWN